MYIALLGRQPELSIAELERVYGAVAWFSADTATIDTKQNDTFDIQRLGGTQKAGKVIAELQHTDWRKASAEIVRHFTEEWSNFEGKITLGISTYGLDLSPREVQKTGLVLKSKLKARGISLRLVPNQESALSTATSHHNKLGLSSNKVELLIVKGQRSIIVAQSIGAQNITALAHRDQGRPRRDAFVGMLPPKLAQMMVNFATGPEQNLRVLDPFCGTGVILQEAALMGHAVYGTDLAPKMIDYSRDNLTWLQETVMRHKIDLTLEEGDAMSARWNQPIGAVAAETYLGQPFSAPPSPAKLKEVQNTCNFIIGSFLKNLADQIAPGTQVALAVPAWKDKEGYFSHLPLSSKPEGFGFDRIELKTVETDRLMYFRPDQVVAREILLLVKR